MLNAFIRCLIVDFEGAACTTIKRLKSAIACEMLWSHILKA